ncbi:hypothetical protein NPX13_g5911 [Xylaria arbuscula]|uniref:Uncharacterized protein n=1 Tax=Xylaria arbuscula TaxID=114810 RepID=A0A9W8TMP1_9PEZI|nr:hypothetical protein NPX13_g5911 [Xylaria arbuscula]
MENDGFAIPSFDYDDLDLDFSTPFVSQGENPTYSSELRGERTILEPSASAPEPSRLSYTISWKLHLRKGRLAKLTEDTVEDVVLSPESYWNEVLESEIATLVKSRLPEPEYQPDETLIVVSSSKRGEPPLHKRFDRLAVDWAVIESKLNSWRRLGSNLKLAISFIYKESQPNSSREGKAGRGATKKHSAALDRLVAQQEASGTRAVWKDVYQLMECYSATCTNRGFSCWRNNEKHYKLDSDIMDKLVDFAEEGHQLDTHADVPREIREVILQRRDEEEIRRRRKRKASEPLPVNVRVFCHGRPDDTSVECSSESENQPAQLELPVPEDEAPVLYSHWLISRITNRRWQEASRLAGEVAVDRGYDLHWLFAHQKAGKEMLVQNGVLEGVAARFVSWISKWVDEARIEEC